MKKGYPLSFKNCFCTIFNPNDCEIVKLEIIENSFPLFREYFEHLACALKHDHTVSVSALIVVFR